MGYILFFALAVLGLLATGAMHVASYLPCRIPREALFLCPGIFVVWLPAVISVQRRAEARGGGRDRTALVEGAPRWWKIAMFALAAAAVVSALLAKAGGAQAELDIDPAGIEAPSEALRFLTGIAMAFYALAAIALHPARFLEKDPATRWPESGSRELVLALPDGSLNDIRLGQPAGHLRAFGRPDNSWPSRSEKYIFRRLGLIVETENGCVDYVALVLDDMEGIGLEPRRAALALARADGARLELGARTVLGDVIAFLGEPDERDEDAEERVHVYRKMGVRFELEYALDGRLRRINAYRG